MGTVEPRDPNLIIGLISAILFVIIGFFYCLSQHRVLAAVQKRHRRIAPGLVWLQFVPLLGQIWQIFVIVFIADSLRAETESHRDDTILGIDAGAVESYGRRPTLGPGVVFYVTWLLMVAFNLLHDPKAGGSDENVVVAVIPAILALASIVFFVLYWVKLVRSKQRMIRLRA